MAESRYRTSSAERLARNRKRVNRFRGVESVRFREMAAQDEEACLQLLDRWRRRQGRKHGFLLDLGYPRVALRRYGEWGREDLQGWCVELDGRVAGFAMAGKIKDDLASFFVLKTDLEVRGLSEYVRWEVYRVLSRFPRVNDGGDLGLPGLRQHKQKLRPVARLPVYSATALPDENSAQSL